MSSAPFVFVLVASAFVACALPQQRGPRSQAVPTAPTAALQDPGDSIARFEDMRTDGDGMLQIFAIRGSDETRVRAVRALGRLPLDEYGSSVSDSLAAALEDASVGVRSAAAFALGMRGDPRTCGALIAALDDDSSASTPEVRALCIEALSRIDDPRARRAVIDALGPKGDTETAEAAAFGIQRFAKGSPETAAAEAELVRFAARCGDPLDKREQARPLQWQALSTLARRAVVGAREEFERGVSARSPETRLFALQGLGMLPPEERASELLRSGLEDTDWRVACEAAVALGKHADASAVADLIAASTRTEPERGAPHVRRCALEALGRIASAADVARSALESARSDESRSVRAAAVEAGARLYRDAFAAELDVAARDADPVVRAGAAASIAHLSPTKALELFARLGEDRDLRVATTAVDALGEHAADAAVHERLRALLSASDNGVRLSAASALKSHANEEDLPALVGALASTRGEIAPEVAAAIVDAAARVGGDRAFALLAKAAADPDPYVARKARAAALAIRPEAKIAQPAPQRRNGPLPAKLDAKPRVALETTRGPLVFELEPDLAPFHVANLLELARAGHYDGTRIHRVVPDFVVQGGDVRGDGNGGKTWRGHALRGEFTERRFRRGTLGMPRNDDPDSGGSQIFVTHRPTPHLDGRYTVFGELIEGDDVLDALEVGDSIVRVRVLDGEPRESP